MAFYEQERIENFEFYSKFEKLGLDKLIHQLNVQVSSRADVCKELISHVNKIYQKFNENNGQPSSSTTINFSQDVRDSNNKAQRKRKELAAQKRAKIIAKMTELQKNFMEKNLQLCTDNPDDPMPSTSPGTRYSSMISSTDQEILSTSPNSSFKFEPMVVDDSMTVIQPCLGTNDIELSTPMKQTLTCIFCQENSEVKLNSKALVLSAYVQKLVLLFFSVESNREVFVFSSRVLSKNRARRIENWDAFDPTFMSNDLHWGIHVSSCGHAIHADCWTK